MSTTIRPASIDDLPYLAEIYNHYVLHTAISFDLEPVTIDERREWFQQFAVTGPYRLLVAENAGKVVGYGGSFQFRTRKAYDSSVETTVYCAPEAVGRGIGRLLYGALFDALRDEKLRMAVAAIAVLLHDIGRKFDRYWDVAWYEKRLT
jgi:phosphinothricin acetyltransferase